MTLLTRKVTLVAAATLFLALGLTTWTASGVMSAPAAPLMSAGGQVRITKATSASTLRFAGARDPFKPPKGWKSPRCGLGPPPRLTLDDAAALPGCKNYTRRYEELCGGGGRNQSASYTGVYGALCLLNGEDGAVAGHPLHVMVGSIRANVFGAAELTCGPPQGTYDVLDVRVEGPRSIEYAFVTQLQPWTFAVSFRPLDAGEYKVFVRPHLLRQPHDKDGWEFHRKKSKSRLAMLPGDKCPLRSCSKDSGGGNHLLCMSAPAFRVRVATSPSCQVPNYDSEELPTCAEAGYPTMEDHYFGRWVYECRAEGSQQNFTSRDCEAAPHEALHRPLDPARAWVKNIRLLKSIGACGNSHPSMTRRYSRFVFRGLGGWVYRPHACRGRVFSNQTAWRCLNGSGLLTLGDSVASTNSHLLWVWMNMEPSPYKEEEEEKRVKERWNETYFSERGNRQDELYGYVRKANPGSAEEASYRSFLNQITRQNYYHLARFTTELNALVGGSSDQDRMQWAKVRAGVMQMGLHDVFKGNRSPNVTDMAAQFRLAFQRFPYPLVVHPAPGVVVTRMCTKKNSDRGWRVNAAYSEAFSSLSQAGLIPPTAVLPTTFMTRSLSWEVPTMDDSGTHPYCSFVGLAMWMQTLDLVCPTGVPGTRTSLAT